MNIGKDNFFWWIGDVRAESEYDIEDVVDKAYKFKNYDFKVLYFMPECVCFYPIMLKNKGAPIMYV